jgi:hypothetical protein
MLEITQIENKIFEIRGQKVMLDYDLALIYEVETKRINEQVKRNLERFPVDFMFRLTVQEWEIIWSQIATSSAKDGNQSQIATSTQKHRGKNTPFAFTEHGVTMLASVLRSTKTIKMNIAIVRTFINLRRYINHNPNLNDKLNDIRLELKTRIDEHDTQLNAIYETLENLLDKKHRLFKN